jgi:hypothetical protein
MQEKDAVLIFNRWKIAHQRATDAESALFHAALLSTSGAAPAPREADWKDAKALREEARQLFRQAMAAVDQMNTRAARINGAPAIVHPWKTQHDARREA